jgi:plasmid maintenance system antidote protein VapI
LWLRMQANYDLWQAEQKFKAAPMRVRRAPTAT